MNSPSVGAEIRQMTVADLDRVMAIALSLPDAPRWPEATYLDLLKAESKPRRIALIAASPMPGTAVGFAVASFLPPQAELESIAVTAQSQRQGLGRELFDALARKLRAKGVKEIVLEVRGSNRPALAFYRCLGFTKTGLRRSYYTDPVEDALLMRLRLG